VHLHDIWLNEKARFATSAPADYKHVFVSRIGGIFRAAVHGEPFGLRQKHIVIKIRVYIRGYVGGRSP